jgi:glycerol-3-phosphate acyltransferase PlsX
LTQATVPTDLPIVIDAMGGDHGPGVVVRGVLAAEREFGGAYLLVGRGDEIRAALAESGAAPSGTLRILEAEDVITMKDAPVEAVREKKDSSMVRAGREVREGRGSALISPGNTGAMLATGTLILGRTRGVERPGIATVIPTATGYSILIDVGANVDSRPSHLLHFAIMGAAYAQAILGIAAPRIGLLSIGEEPTKGNELVLETRPLMERFFAAQGELGSFLGNVEGREIVNGRADVVVCDGFVGNVILKFGEGLAFTIVDLLKERLTAKPHRRLAALFLKNAFTEFKRKIDYAEYGGAPLLGVKHPCIICHGSSREKAIKNAVRVARQAIKENICERIGTMVSRIVDRPANGEAAS